MRAWEAGVGAVMDGAPPPASWSSTAATAVWGSTFVVTKGSLQGMAAPSFLTWRFGIAAVVLAVVGRRGCGP